MLKILETWRRQLIGTFSNNATEIPQWELELAKGDDTGYFGTESAVWAVHGSMTPVIAGIRALLLQALHPGAMAGVHDFSDYKEDPLGRLAGTIRWIFTVTYGDTKAARSGSEWVLRLHERVHGMYEDAAGVERPYSANDPEIARWVHLAFTDAFLSSHQRFGGPIPGGPDAYVSEWAVAGELMRIDNPPRSEAELRAQMAAYDGELRDSAYVQEALGFLRRPPLPRSQLMGYRVLFAGAVSSLEPRHRELLGLKEPRIGPFRIPMRLPVKAVLGVIRLGLGPQGPSERSARERIARLSGGR
ncbi:oxygenase MpaB family protein [Arthrobacter sp. APC 3897]|uniref:oxygenase MpaB family protein n=1 Tax=Arthrobacter sp. APC 3897 TaxID=3035204 RepID=UPI0025B37B18|nr:oxygenase MpaB family protein [Arthrobacter sp. APC 3897]MDN3481395.1 oxygenase MpaB family protein [Arthrobacter sp. APC 3897]